MQEVLLNSKIAIDQNSSGLVDFIAGQYLILGNTGYLEDLHTKIHI